MPSLSYYHASRRNLDQTRPFASGFVGVDYPGDMGLWPIVSVFTRIPQAIPLEEKEEAK